MRKICAKSVYFICLLALAVIGLVFTGPAAGSASQASDLTGRPRMGITITTLSGEPVDDGLLPHGAYVLEVEDGSPAAAAGVQPFDIIVELDKQPILSSNDVTDIIRNLDAGDVVQLVVYRTGVDLSSAKQFSVSGETISLTLNLAVVDDEPIPSAADAPPKAEPDGLLPPLEDTIGRAAPSLGDVLGRYPDSEVLHEDGSETDLYLHVNEEEFSDISIFLEQEGAVLSDYQVTGSVMKAVILINNVSFGFEYDSGRQQIEVSLPSGVYDPRLKSARTHLAAAKALYEEGKEAEAGKELAKIPQAETYAPAVNPFKDLKASAQAAPEGGTDPAKSGTESSSDPAPAPAGSESASGVLPDAVPTPAPADVPASSSAVPEPAEKPESVEEPASAEEPAPASAPTPVPTDEPYPLPDDADRSVRLSAERQTVGVGKKLQLKAEVTKLKDDAPKSSELEWVSEDPAVATVSEKGTVEGVRPGSVRITVGLKDRPEIRTFLRISVVNPVKSVKTAEKNLTLLYGASEKAATGKISVIIEPADATVQSCFFVSSNEAVLKVDEEGNLRAVGPGKARITVTSAEEGSRAKADCTVTVAQAVKSISMPRSLTIDKQKNAPLKAEIGPKNATAKALEYSSSNPRVATVAKNGTISAVSTGKATITAKATDGSGVTASCEVTVIQPVTRISSNTKKLVFFQGQERKWSVSVEPGDATTKTLKFSSDDPYVASIDQNGRISGKHGGKAKVTATATDGSGKSFTCNVVVEPSVPLTLDSIGYGIYMGNLFAMTVKNECSSMTIVDYDFDLYFYDYSGNLVNGGSFNLGKQERIGPGRTKTIKRTVYGTSQAYKTKVTITGVEFSDGTTWSIPSSQQETWTFTR